MTDLAAPAAPAAPPFVPLDPLCRWAGGKGPLLARAGHRLPRPEKARGYREPFVGAGALFFGRYHGVRPAILADTNPHLIATYLTIRDAPAQLLFELDPARNTYGRALFEAARESLNAHPGAPLLLRARWFLIVMGWGFNGLWRVNGAGACNTPFGKPSQPGAIPKLVDPDHILAMSRSLQGVEILCAPFEESLADPREDEVIYLDPPYAPVSFTANFTSYTADGFTYARPGPQGQGALFDHQEAGRSEVGHWATLRRLLVSLHKAGVHWVLSQAATPEMKRDLAGLYTIELNVPRTISSKTTTREPVPELLVSNRPFPSGEA